ncbi:HDOD domain-containing protein [Propionivibrio sp.]|uniref:HDOD domain-containing protein n=1 Tax=Propionivibrio sp. TaxID=2212460 RepID=UPI003BF21C6F
MPICPFRAWASIVGVEPLVANKLMQLANSALYKTDGTPARDLKAAINRLGVDLVRTTALAIAMRQLMRSKDMAIFSELTHALWIHSLKTAATARILAGPVHELGTFYMLYRAAKYPELRVRPDTVKYLIMQWH